MVISAVRDMAQGEGEGGGGTKVCGWCKKICNFAMQTMMNFKSFREISIGSVIYT